MSDHIPLTQVRTASSATGARKAGEGILAGSPDSPNDEEKKGLFGKRGGRRKAKNATRRNTNGEEISVNGLGRFYTKIVNFSVVTRYMLYVAPVGIILALPVVIFAVFHPNSTVGKMRLYLFFTWIEIIWLSIWVSKLCSKAVPYIFMFLCGVVSTGVRKYASILKNLEIPLSLVGWAITSVVTFTALSSPNLNKTPHNPDGTQDGWIKTMRNVLIPTLISSILFLGEKLVVQLISVNYHRRSFDGRIKESKHLIHLLGLLYEASRTLFPMYCPEFAEEDYVISDSIEAILAKTNRRLVGHNRSGSNTPMKLIGEMGRIGDKVTSVFGNIASEITGKQVFNPNSAHSVVIEALEKTKSSEALARRLWMSFVVEGRDSLSAEDLEEVLGNGRKAEAEEIFDALDNDGNGDISLDEMIMKVVEIGRDRKAIAKSMRDVGQAIGVLDQVLVTVVLIIVIFAFIAFQDSGFLATLTTAGTTLLSLSFVFAATTAEFLGACIFLFVKHPYDVGDRCDIDKTYLVVEQISLLFTVFKRIDNMKMVQVPNIVLNNLWIENITRSKAMKEQLDMYISFDTTLEDIELLRAEMEAFVRHPDNSRDFHPDMVLEAVGIGNMDKLQLKVEIRHKSNWHNETVRAARRSKFMCALVLALRKIPINAPGGGGDALGGPANPNYSVAVTDEWAAEAREKSGTAKDAKRLVPTKPFKNTNPDLGPVSEEDAAEALNARRPGLDSAHSYNDGWSSSRDDQMLGDGSFDEYGNPRSSLMKRASTRGRRKPGEHLPANSSGFSVTIDGPRDTSYSNTFMTENNQASPPYHSSYGGSGHQKYTPFPVNPSGQLGRNISISSARSTNLSVGGQHAASSTSVTPGSQAAGRDVVGGSASRNKSDIEEEDE
ncbi:Mechanosensitive ion channel protein [Rutstroemia sp. NJR-2017a BVV2]|nr:Mechanosensitive ion channel protein [Rutstroemia sp. NJR-2017a BVV2]